jgi:hypothetical protein
VKVKPAEWLKIVVMREGKKVKPGVNNKLSKQIAIAGAAVFLFTLLAACSDGPMYNYRYCEVLLGTVESDSIRAEVYNTGGLNTCPQEQWEALDTTVISSEYGVDIAGLNGPRFWVLDMITLNNGWIPGGDTEKEASSTVFFEDLEMRQVATVCLPLDLEINGIPYQVSEVRRDTIFHFWSGRQVYELQDPFGRRYIMQSFSRIVDSNLQLNDLAGLGDRLELPPGWTFSTRTLETYFRLPCVNGVAEIITDDLINTYQYIP